MTITLANVPSVSLAGSAAATADNSRKVIIVWQKSTISDSCKKALGTVTGGVHIYDPQIDGAKFDAAAFAASSWSCLVLWAGNPASKTAAADVHDWLVANRPYIKQTKFIVYVIPKKFFSFLGLQSVYEDFATAIKALPKWHPDLHKLLLNFEEQFPEAEHSALYAIYQKLVSLITKKE